MNEHKMLIYSILISFLDRVDKLSIQKDKKDWYYVSNPTLSTLYNTIKRVENKFQLPDEWRLGKSELEQFLNEFDMLVYEVQYPDGSIGVSRFGLDSNPYIKCTSKSYKLLHLLGYLNENTGVEKRAKCYTIASLFVSICNGLSVWGDMPKQPNPEYFFGNIFEDLQ